MLPTLRPGDRLLVRYGAQALPGRLALVRLRAGVVAVKRVTAVAGHDVTVESDNVAEGYAGIVAREEVLAAVLVRVWPWPRPLR